MKKEVLTEENIKRVCDKFNFANEEDMHAAVGFNGITVQQVVNRLTEKLRKEKEAEKKLEKITKEMAAPSQRRETESGVIVPGIENLLIRLSRCCSPVPGDEIVGYITKGRGVSVHRADCPNVSPEDSESRLIDVDWAGSSAGKQKEYQVDIEISGFDRPGLLNEVMYIVNDLKTVITAVSAKGDKNKIATIHLTLLITNITHLHRIVERIKQIRDIYYVQRVTN